MSDLAVAYTLSDKRDMVSDIIPSLQSLGRFMDKEDIMVFYTPPRTNETAKLLSRYSTVIPCENIVDKFVFKESFGSSGYGEKAHICDVERENVIFLDCDTRVNKPLQLLLEGDYDFAGRPADMRDFDLNIWYTMFNHYGKDPISMFNSGFMIFKNKTHQKIKEELLFYLGENLPRAHLRNYQKDQYSISLAVSGLKIRNLTNNEHAFRWYNEEHVDTFVLHGSQVKFKYLKQFLRNTYIIKKIRTPSYRKLATRYLTRVLSLPIRPSLVLLKLFANRDIVAVEVGVSRGANAKNMLSRIPRIKKMYLVDPYRYIDDVDEQHRVEGDLEEHKLAARKNLEGFKDRTVFIYEPFSSEVIPEKVDFIYIDGDHSTQAVISDIKESLKILNENGIIAGHDIHYESVRRGVETVFKTNYHSIGYDWWVQPPIPKTEELE